MISISLEGLAKTESVLAAVMDARNAQLGANVAAETYETDMLDWIAEGKAFTTRTGGLAQSVGWHSEGGGAVVYANKDYAQYVEAGTGIHAGHSPWVIRPIGGRKGLKNPEAGGAGFVIRRSVVHPGARPYPFFYADLDERKANMEEAVRSLLLDKLRRLA